MGTKTKMPAKKQPVSGASNADNRPHLDIILRAQKGDQDAKHEIIKIYENLVAAIVAKYNTRTETREDILQAGNVGLMHALERFDDTRGVKFATYATWWIRNSIQRYFERVGRYIRLPRNMEQRIRQVQQTYTELTHELAREPTIDEISNKLNVNTKTLNRTLELHNASTHTVNSSLNNQLDIDAIAFSHTRGPEEQLERKYELDTLRKATDNLSDIQKKIVALRYRPVRTPMSIRKIAEQLNMVDYDVRMQLEKAMEIIRKFINQN